MPADVILFLCTGNYYRSRFAEILFNHLARKTGLNWTAVSRGLDLKIGSHNVGPLSPHTRLACHQRKLPLAEPVREPLAVCEDDLKRAKLIVAVKEAEHRAYLAKLFPEWVDRVKYWHVHDLDAAGPEQALTELEAHVRALASELAETPRLS